MTIRAHHVLVVAQRIESQQAIDTDAAQLYKAAVLHHGRDEPVERLPETLAQVAALEKAVDVTVGFIRAFLESRKILSHAAKLLGRIRIGDRVLIGANAVVVTDVPDDHIAVGVPARIRPRRPHNSLDKP